MQNGQDSHLLNDGMFISYMTVLHLPSRQRKNTFKLELGISKLGIYPYISEMKNLSERKRFKFSKGQYLIFTFCQYF